MPTRARLLAVILVLSIGPLAAAQAPAAEGAAPPGGSIMSSPIIPMVLCMAVFYVFIILLPERKARKKRAEMLANLAKGTKVLTNSGMYGTVMQVQDQVATLQIADGVRARFALSAVQSVVEEPAGEAEKPKT
jgi:preprotein translocase subunit YajC